ncbi:MAG: hypothetical protein Q6361_08555, partial [Candidatus Hermodarchaeota archaeon]|nr:hypothetical protein [Candidatus Hermodarchaeota archaeon]
IKVVNLVSLIVAPILISWRFSNFLFPVFNINLLLINLALAVFVFLLVTLLVWAFRRSRRALKPIAEWESRD